MNFRNISAWSIRNPIPPLVLFFAFSLGGIASFMGLEVQNNPDIDFPGAVVVITQPGAAPTELEAQVSQRVEAAMRNVEGVDELNSTVTEGRSQTFVQFAIGTPIERAVNDVRDQLSQIRGKLPDGILEPQVIRLSTSGSTLAYFSVQSTDMTIEQLSWYVDNTVAKKLLSIPGMGDVTRGGGVSREIRVALKPVQMQAFGLSASSVNQQLRAINVNAAGGRLEIAQSEQSVRVLGNASSAYRLGQVEITVGNGRRVKLADIATVSDAYGEQRSITKSGGRQVLSVAFERAKGASDVSVYDGAVQAFRDLEKGNPGISFAELFTDVNYAKDQYHSALAAMLEGAVLAVLVVFLFLRDWRATLVSAMAIPLSAVPAFGFMNIMGFTLNSMALLGLSLVAGVLVDDAIVEIENIVRHMRMGKSAYQAAIDAADEIGLAVVATTMTIVAVFLPVGLMPGVPGQYFKNFSLTVVAAVLVSLAVARMITPMLAAYFLRNNSKISAHGRGRAMERYLAILRWSLDENQPQIQSPRIGRRVLAKFKDHRVWVIGLGLLAFIVTVCTFMQLPMTFFPPGNGDTTRISIQLVPGATLQQTEAVADQVAAKIGADPIVERSFESIDVGNATVYVILRKDRSITTNQFERDRYPMLQSIPDARISFQSQQGGGGSTRDVSVTLGGDDPDKLMAAARLLVEGMLGIEQLRTPRIEGNLERPEFIIKPNFSLAADLGVTTAALSQAIRVATLGEIEENAAKFSLSGRQVPITVAMDRDMRQRIDTLRNLPVPSQNGGTVPLSLVAEISSGSGPIQIDRVNQVRRITIGADLGPGVVTSQATEKIDALPIMKSLPQGVTRIVLGQVKWQAEMLRNFAIAVVAGITLVLLVLILLYRRIVPPFVNIGSLLLAPLGGALALLVTGNPVSLFVFIGLLMLLGIVGKNSILLIDFAIEEIGRGVEKSTAIIDAGHKRAQPIVMTTVAMVAGMIPTALSLGGDGSWRAPMGITLIGGLIASTLLTLVIVPATLSLALDIESRLASIFRRIIVEEQPDMRIVALSTTDEK